MILRVKSSSSWSALLDSNVGDHVLKPFSILSSVKHLRFPTTTDVKPSI